MNKPNNPQDNVPQSVKSVEVPPHEQCLDRMSDLLDKMDWIIEKDKALARITELEARNKELMDSGKSFLAFIQLTELSQKDKYLVKGVFYGWIGR